jgi:REP element-mobilizing transposase RayT
MPACSILHNHVHAVVMRHANPAERIIGHLKARATQALLNEQMHPFSSERSADGRVPCVWAQRGWKVFLDSPEDIDRAIRYVRNNPIREGHREQNWSFLLSDRVLTD